MCKSVKGFRMICVFLSVMMFAAFPAGAQSDSQAEWLAVEDLEKYIELGEYRGLHAEKVISPITDEDVDKAVEEKITDSGAAIPEELTDEWVSGHTDYSTVTEFKDAVRESLRKSMEAKAQSDLEDTLFQMVEEDTKILGYPEDRKAALTDEFSQSVESYASSNDLSLEEYLETVGYTDEEYRKYAEEYAQAQLEREMIMQGILESEGLEIGDDTYMEYLEDLAKLLGAAGGDALVKAYGEEDVRESVVWNEISDILIENAEIVEVSG